MKPPHTWDLVALDAGIHHCTVCGAVNEALAPTCALERLSEDDFIRQRAVNLAKYGEGKWLITIYRGQDVRVDTVVLCGLPAAPT